MFSRSRGSGRRSRCPSAARRRAQVGTRRVPKGWRRFRCSRGPSGASLQACGERVAGWDLARLLARAAVGEDDLLVRGEFDARRVGGDAFAVDVGTELVAAVVADAADAAVCQADAPDGEELAERVGGLGRRFDVDDPARVVGVERVEVALLLVDT